MINARIKLNTGKITVRTFEDRGVLTRFLDEGHELIIAIEIT